MSFTDEYDGTPDYWRNIWMTEVESVAYEDITVAAPHTLLATDLDASIQNATVFSLLHHIRLVS